MATSKKVIKNICRDYVTIDYNGVIDFKLTLKDNIRNNSISEDDALFILLDLLYQINHGLKYKFFSKNLFDLITDVKKYNKENKKYLKEKILFKKHYYHELKQVIDYIISLAKERNIESKNITIEKPKENIKNRKKLIKTKLKDFQHNDLCCILNLDHTLNFEREKVLKNRIVDALLEMSFDEDKLNNCSTEDIKEILNSNNESSGMRNEEIIKIQNVRLYKLLDEFEDNYKIQLEKEEKLKKEREEQERRKKQEQERLRKEAEIKARKLKIENEHLQKERQEKQRQINSLIEKEIKTNIGLLNSFDDDLKNNGFLNYSKREKIINTYKSLYELTSEVNKFPIFLKNRIYQEFPNLKSFMEYYKDLINYKNLSDEKHNRIKKLNERILDDEIKDNPEFFKNITDPNKRRAIVIDEKNVKVNAGAGTGKTFTIQNKVNYLIEKRGISPKKILCLCYTGDGAED